VSKVLNSHRAPQRISTNSAYFSLCRFVFKGSDNDEAVLCTSKNTYLVREVETTNLVMLIQDPNSGGTGAVEGTQMDRDDGEYAGRGTQQAMLERRCQEGSPVSVTALATAHLELTMIRPKLNMLDRALKRDHVIKDIITSDVQSEGGHQLPSGISLEALVDCVQASGEEISVGLRELSGVRVNGQWMGVSPDALSSFVRLVLLTAAEHGWNLDAVPYIGMAVELEKHGVCGQITLQLLNIISRKDDSHKISIEDMDRLDWREMAGFPECCCLDTATVCKHVGIGMLLEKERWENRDDFISSWVSNLPESMNPSIDMLQGECLELDTEIIGEHGQKTVGIAIQRLPAGELSRDPVERFEKLFEIKREWTLNAVEPYIHNLTGPGQTVEELLLRFARPVQKMPDDEVTYTAR
jgi:sister chromatid cohesion protein DCC1